MRRPRIVNFDKWRAHTLSTLRQQTERRSDPVIQGLLAEVAAYPGPSSSAAPEELEASQRLATPLRIATRLGTVSFLNTVTFFGTPNDVTLAELALEMLFPADDQTVEIVKSMVQEQGISDWPTIPLSRPVLVQSHPQHESQPRSALAVLGDTRPLRR